MMRRRPFVILSILLLAVAAVQAAAVTLSPQAASPAGEVCTACGPVR